MRIILDEIVAMLNKLSEERGLNTRAPWYYTKEFNVFQKKEDRVYVYIGSHGINSFKIQLYQAGDTGMCELEYRDDSFWKCYEVAEEWLYEFSKGDVSAIRRHTFSPHNPEGYWQTVYYKR